MVKPKNKKICIVVMSLSGGGAERSSAILSKVLSNLGHEIHLVTVLDIIDYDYKGTLFNLGKLKKEKETIYGKLKRFKVFKEYLKLHNFDIVIDSRYKHGLLKEYIISRWLYKPHKTIYFVRSFKIKTYIVFNQKLAKYIYGDAYKIIGVSKAITDKLSSDFGLKNTKTIYNFVEINKISEKIKHINSDSYILFYGRIQDSVKNLSLLIDSYSKSILPSRNIKLKIMGKGEDVNLVKEKIERYNLRSKIEILDFMKDPFSVVKNAVFIVLTSRYEGFPRVILESLAIGTPVISVDCSSGPKELIENEYNGLLVENYNPEALAEAMNTFIRNNELYKYCKSNTQKSVEQFSIDKISTEWSNLFEAQ